MSHRLLKFRHISPQMISQDTSRQQFMPIHSNSIQLYKSCRIYGETSVIARGLALSMSTASETVTGSIMTAL